MKANIIKNETITKPITVKDEPITIIPNVNYNEANPYGKLNTIEFLRAVESWFASPKDCLTPKTITALANEAEYRDFTNMADEIRKRK